MPESTHTLNVNIRGDNSGFRNAVKDSRDALQSFSKTVDSETGKKTANAFNSAAQGIRNMVKEMQLASGKKVYTDEFKRIQKDVGATTESIKKMEHELGVMEQAGKNVGTSNRFRQAEQQAEALQHRYEQLNAVRNDMTKNPAYSNMEKSLQASNQRLEQLIENNKVLKNMGADKELSPQYEKLAERKQKFEENLKQAQAEMQRLEREGAAYKKNEKYAEAEERVDKAKASIQQYMEEVNNTIALSTLSKKQKEMYLETMKASEEYKGLERELVKAETELASLAGKELIATDAMKQFQRAEREAGNELTIINTKMAAMEKAGGKFGTKEWQANLKGIEAEKKAQAELNNELVRMREGGNEYLPKDEEEKKQRLESLNGEIEDQKRSISEMQEMRDQITSKPEDADARAEYEAQQQALDGMQATMKELAERKADLEGQLELSRDFDEANRTITETAQKLAEVNKEAEELYRRGEDKSVNEDFKAVQDAYESKQKEVDRLEEQKKRLEAEGKAYDPTNGGKYGLSMPQDYLDADNKLKLAEAQLSAAEAAAKAAKEQDKDTAEQELAAARQARDEARQELISLINERGKQGNYHETGEYKQILDDLENAREELIEFKKDYEEFDKGRRVGSNRYQELGKQEEELMRTLELAQIRRQDAMDRGALSVSSKGDNEDELRAVQAQIQETDKEMTNLLSKHESLGNYLKGLGNEEGYQGLVDTLDNIKEKQQGVIDQFEELSKKKEELDKKRESVQQQRDKDVARLAEYEEDEKEGHFGSSKRKKAGKLRGRIASADEELADIDAQRSGIDNQLGNLHSEIEKLTEQYDGLIAKQSEFLKSGDYSQKSQAYEDLVDKIAETKQIINELEGSLAFLESSGGASAYGATPAYEELIEKIREKELEAEKIQEQANAYSEMYALPNGTVPDTPEYDEILEKAEEVKASLREMYAEKEEMEASGDAGEFLTGYIEAIKEVKAELADLEAQKASIDSGNGGLANEEAAKIDEQIAATEQRLQDLMSAFETTMNSGTLADMPIADQLKTVDQAIEHTISQIERMEEAIRRMQETGTDQGSDEYVKMIDRRNQAMERLENLRAMSDQLQQSGGDVQDNTEGVNASVDSSKRLASAMRSTGRHGVSAAKSIQDAWNGISKIFDMTTNAIKKTGGTFASMIKKFASGIPQIGNAFNKGFAGNGLKNISGTFSRLTGNILKGTPVLGKFVGAMQSGRGSVTSFLGPMTKAIPIVNKFFGATNQGHMSLKKGFMTFIKYAFGVRSLYFLFRRLRNAVKEAFGNIAKEDDTVQHSLNDLTASMNMLKNSVGAAFAPLINIVAPILSQFVRKIAEAINSVGAFFAALTGQSTYKKAVYNLAAVENAQKKTASSSKKTADEAKRTVLAFDELNKLDDNNDSNSGSGDNGTNFNTEEVPNQFADWAQKFKDAWAKADFTEIGKEIGDTIGSLLYKIPWVEIEQKVTHLAKSLGTFVNGLIKSTKMWQAFGYTAARALNVAMKGYNQFMKQIDFKKYGEDLSQMLKTFKDNFNWMGKDGLGEYLSAMPNAMIDTLTGFLNDFTWQDFKDIGSKLGGAINQAIRLTHWEDFFPDVIKLATGILAAINGFLERQPWKEIIPKIEAGMANISKSDWITLGTQIGDLIKNGLNGVTGILDAFTALLEGLSWSDVFEGVTTSLSQYTGWSTLGSSIGNAIYQGLKSSAEIVGGFIDVLKEVKWKDIFDSFSSTITENMKDVDWKSIGNKIGDAIGVAADILNGVLEGFTKIIGQVNFREIFDGVKETIQEKMAVIEEVTTYDENGNPVTQKMNGWQKLGHNIADAITTGLKASGEIIGGFVNVLSSVPWTQIWDEFNKTVGTKMSTVNWTNVGDTIGKAITTGLQNIGGIARAFTTIMQNIRWDEIFGGIKDTINRKMGEAVKIKDVDELGHVEFKNGGSTKWEKLGADIGDALKQGLKAAVKIVLGVTEILMSIDWHGLLTHLADHLFGDKDGKLDENDWTTFKDSVKNFMESETARDAIKFLAGVAIANFLFQEAAGLLGMFGTSLAAGLGGKWAGGKITGITILAAVDLLLDLNTNWNKPSNKGKNLTKEEAEQENKSGWGSFWKSTGEGALMGFLAGGFGGAALGAIAGAAANATSQKPGSNTGIYAHEGQDYYSLNVIDPDGKSWLRMSDGRWIKGTNRNKNVNVIKAKTWEEAASYFIPGASEKATRENPGKYDALGGANSASDYKPPTAGNEYGLAGGVHLFDNKTTSMSKTYQASNPLSGIETGTLTVGVKTTETGGGLFSKIKSAWDSSAKDGVKTDPKLTKGGKGLYTDVKNDYTKENQNNPVRTVVKAASNSGQKIHGVLQNFMKDQTLTTGVKEKSGTGTKIKTSLQGDLDKNENTLNANVTASDEKKKTLVSSIQTWFNENPIGVTIKKAATNIFSSLFGGKKEKEEEEESVNVKLNATDESKKALRNHIQAYFDGEKNGIYVRLAEKTNASSDLKGIIQDFFDGNGHEIKMRFKDSSNANSSLKKNVQDYFSSDGHEIKTRFLPKAEANATLLSKVQEYFSKKGNELKTHFVIASGVLSGLKSDIQNYFNKRDSEITTYFKGSTYAASNLRTDIQNYFYKAGHEITALFELPSNKYVGSAADLFGNIQSYFNGHTITVYTKTAVSGNSSKKAEGGIFNNGRWQPVTAAASGGTFDSAQMFIAREAGPELVGTIGNKTAVVNNDQIVASVAAGVFEAVVSANQQSQGSSDPLVNDITIMIDSERAYRVVQKGKKLSERRYGTAFSI